MKKDENQVFLKPDSIIRYILKRESPVLSTKTKINIL